jgi:hypothetical protein
MLCAPFLRLGAMGVMKRGIVGKRFYFMEKRKFEA